MKKIIVLISCFTLLSLFVACGNDDNKKSEKNNDNKTTTTTTANNSNNNTSDKVKNEFDANAILDEILETYTFNDMTRLDDPVFLDVLYGIQAEDVKQFSMYINETGISADEIIIIEATDSDASKRVLELLLNWYTAKGVQMKDYIPKEYEKILNSSVKNSGNYIYMIVADNNKDIEKIVEKYL